MLSEMLSYEFMRRALLGGVLVSLCAALLGVSLVLKRYSMIGDGLSHVSFGALSIAIACGFAPIKFSIPIVVIAAFLLLRLAENGKMRSDAAIAMVSASHLLHRDLARMCTATCLEVLWQFPVMTFILLL